MHAKELLLLGDKEKEMRPVRIPWNPESVRNPWNIKSYNETKAFAEFGLTTVSSLAALSMNVMLTGFVFQHPELMSYVSTRVM